MEKIEKMLDRITEFIEQKKDFTPSVCDELSAEITDNETLSIALPKLKEMHENFRSQCEANDSKAKIFSDSKKGWKAKDEKLVQFVGYLLKKLGYKNFSSGDAKASLRTTEVLEVSDQDALLKQYVESQEYQNLKATLPCWVKASLDIDKSALNAFVKVDATLLTTHPEWLSTKESTSVTIK